VGQANRALASRGLSWRWGAIATPGPITAPTLAVLNGVQVTRRHRLEATEATRGTDEVLATVNGDPWLVRSGSTVLLGSRLDTSWTALPATPAHSSIHRRAGRSRSFARKPM
jgi:hypothetical protein